MWGFQLWVNLPARDKMCEPRYQEIPPADVPVLSREDGSRVRVIAGEAGGARGPVAGIATEPLYLDVSLPAGVGLVQAVPTAHNACAYVFEGEARIGEDGTAVGAGQLAVLAEGDAAALMAGPPGARLLLVAGRPLREPVARLGPFVMNTRAELMQAVQDYQSGAF